MKLLEGKNIVITGASRGIGKAIALLFAKHGANIVFTHISSEDEVTELKNELSNEGVRVSAFKSDASHFESSQNLIDKIVCDFGTVDVLVNNAGITKDNLLMRMNEEDFNQVMKVNMNSVFNLTKAVLRPMIKQRSGSIINMSSVVGLKGNAGQSNYSASKSGMQGFSRAFAREVGSRNITVNTVSPGFIETDMTSQLPEEGKKIMLEKIPLGRMGSPQEVACVVKFLASSPGDYITGETIHVNGGLYMS